MSSFVAPVLEEDEEQLERASARAGSTSSSGRSA